MPAFEFKEIPKKQNSLVVLQNGTAIGDVDMSTTSRSDEATIKFGDKVYQATREGAKLLQVTLSLKVDGQPVATAMKHAGPRTSFNFQIDGKDYIFARRAGFFGGKKVLSEDGKEVSIAKGGVLKLPDTLPPDAQALIIWIYAVIEKWEQEAADLTS
jgi:hypothetical protein